MYFVNFVTAYYVNGNVMFCVQGQVTTQELRELLEALDQREAVEKVDAMMARNLTRQGENST